MDDIWRKATKKIREQHVTATQTPVIVKPTATAPTAVPTCSNKNPATSSTLTEEDMNTVEKIDAQLARMELNWAQTRSGPFPERARKAIAKLRASLETETAPASEPPNLAVDVRHVTTAISAPADTAAATIYQTTITTTPAHNTTSITAISEITAMPD